MVVVAPRTTSHGSSSLNRLYFLFVRIILLVAILSLSCSFFLTLNDNSDWRFSVKNGASTYDSYYKSRPSVKREKTGISPSTTTRAVFYNIFIPPEDEENALNIVQEQISHLGTSDLLKQTPVYYTLIGHDSTEKVTTICTDNHVLCRQIRYVEKGDEDLTLQSLFEYCQEHANDVVTYMHSKGSFHPSIRNDNLRAMATKSILSVECQSIDGETCNVCGARFSTFPHYHMSANMFTSHCSYMRNLLPPKIFRSMMDKVMNVVMTCPDPTIPRPTFLQIQNGYSVGTGRYSNEHWLGSHPYILPCDVYPNDYQTGYKKCPSRYTTWTPDLQLAPRYDLSTFLQGTVDRSSWFCGQGRLLEYQLLYSRGTIPPPASFVWNYYTEPFKGCPEPLEYKKHKVLFTNHSILS
jgi:hypothetical protein